jgi:hypothetical protein
VKAKQTVGRAVDDSGGLTQSVKESAIANTEITGIMTKRDARLFVIGQIMRWQALKLVRIRQRRALEIIAHETRSKTKRQLMHRLIGACTDEGACAEDADAGDCIVALSGIQSALETLYVLQSIPTSPRFRFFFGFPFLSLHNCTVGAPFES